MLSSNHSLLETAADSKDQRYYLMLAHNQLLSDRPILSVLTDCLHAASYGYNVVHAYDYTTKINKFFH